MVSVDLWESTDLNVLRKTALALCKHADLGHGVSLQKAFRRFSQFRSLTRYLLR